MVTTSESLDWKQVARLIDHTLLRPEATRQEIISLCEEAEHYGFASVCLQPCWTALAVSILRSTPVKVCSVVGFPHGAQLSRSKRREAGELLRLGADELDMVIHLGALRSGDHAAVERDIRGVVESAHSAGALVKVILEVALLTRDEKVMGCELALAAGADFLKTSTGFGPGGATTEDVRLLREVARNRAGVKAAGGIRTAADLRAMLSAGADRIGSSASVQIVRELGASGEPPRS